MPGLSAGFSVFLGTLVCFLLVSRFQLLSQYLSGGDHQKSETSNSNDYFLAQQLGRDGLAGCGAVHYLISGRPAAHHHVRERLKTVAKILAAALCSLIAAFVWWAYLPAPPPLPGRFLVAFEPIVMFVADRNVHGAEELLEFLEVWCYVVVLLLFVLVGFGAIRRKIGVYALTGSFSGRLRRR